MRRLAAFALYAALAQACAHTVAPRAADAPDAARDAQAHDAADASAPLDAADASAPLDAAGDDAEAPPAEHSLPPSSRAVSDLLGLAVHEGDCPAGADPARVARRDECLRLLRGAGLHRLRREFFWHSIEPERGRLDWAGYDAFVDAASAAGVEVLGVLCYGTPWASARADAGATFLDPPADPALFARYAAAAAQRYAGRVRSWEVWNEPNAGYRFWQPTPRGDPRAYGALTLAAARAVAGVAPDARVSFGGTVFLAQVIPGGVEFAAQTFEATPGLAAALSAFGMHGYSLYPPVRGPESATYPEVPLVAKVRRMAAVSHDAGLDAPLWLTEIGWPVYEGVTEELQARWIVRAALLSALAGVDLAFVYNLREGAEPRSFPPEQSFGLVRDDGAPKPAYRAVQALTAALGAFHVTGRVELPGAPRDLHALSLADGARRALALWRADDAAAPYAWRPPAGVGRIVGLFGTERSPDARGEVAIDGSPVYAIIPE